MKSTLQLFAFLAIATSPCIAMGPGNDGARPSFDPHFIPLDPDENSYSGHVIDNKLSIDCKNISFAGSTRIGGMRKENDDSISSLDLARVQNISIKNPFYKSPRHSNSNDQPLFVQTVVTFILPDNSTKSEEYLIPHDIAFSAEECTTGVQKAWKIRDIDSLSVDHSLSATTILERELDEHDHQLDKKYFEEKEQTAWGTTKRWLRAAWGSFKAFVNIE